MATAVSVPSDAVRVIVELPTRPPGVKTVTVRFEPAPPRIRPAAGTTAVFDDVAVTASGLPSGSTTENGNGPDETGVPAW